MHNRTYRVRLIDGTHFDVTTTMEAWCAWEASANRSAVTGDLRLRDHFWVAWKSCMAREIPVDLQFEAWLKKVEGIEVVVDEHVRPTDPAPTAGH
jgi:hypothetical protein